MYEGKTGNKSYLVIIEETPINNHIHGKLSTKPNLQPKTGVGLHKTWVSYYYER